MLAVNDSTAFLRAVRAELAILEKNVGVRDPGRFAERAAVLDRLEFRVLEPLRDAAAAIPASPERSALTRRAAALHAVLEAVDEALFDRVRNAVRRGVTFRDVVRREAGLTLDVPDAAVVPGYDHRDAFIDGLFAGGPDTEVPAETKTLEPEMVSYQKTPVRVVAEMARILEAQGVGPDDVFYDLGSGFGQVSLLTTLLCGMPSRGVEFEPSYCVRAARTAAELGLGNTGFVNADVRAADLSDGTVFFLYTPFTGGMLAGVMESLRSLAARRPLRVFSYGPCTLDVAKCAWLQSATAKPASRDGLGVFRSV